MRQSIARQEKSLREMVDPGFRLLCQSEVMYEILDDLHKLAAEGKLSCQCGNMDVEVEVFEKVELRCPSWGIGNHRGGNQR